jgi:hypothetical protein
VIYGSPMKCEIPPDRNFSHSCKIQGHEPQPTLVHYHRFGS